MNRIAALLLGTLLLAAVASSEERQQGGQEEEQKAPLQVEGYARETPPGVEMSAAYLTLHNRGTAARRLLAVELPGRAQASADLHTTVEENGVSRMRPLELLEVPAGGSLRMAPGGVHLMLHGVRLRAGEQLPLRLRFADGQAIEISVPVRKLRATADPHRHHHG
ncbi:copper chaperone PCu(A)C [Microbulbifer sp.]|uniref:copper chaperone PCu(A)C n=1 Tax=Microbulbifer sp. TaxID=1908541 RepID=UPI003F315C18